MAGPRHAAIHELLVFAGFCQFEITVISPGAVQGFCKGFGQAKARESADKSCPEKCPERRRRRSVDGRVNYSWRAAGARAAICSDTTAFLKNTLSLDKCFFSWTWPPRE